MCVFLLLSACLLCCLIVRLALELQLVSGPEEILLVPLKRNEGSSPEGWTQPHVFSESISDWTERSVPRPYFSRICLQIWPPVIANAAASEEGFCLINFTYESEIFSKTQCSAFLFDPRQQVPLANGTTNSCSSSKCEVKLELAFEYLMSKDRLQWVTITSQQVRGEIRGEKSVENSTLD